MAPSLDVSSYGDTQIEATGGITEAIQIFLEEAGIRGTLKQELERMGWTLFPRYYLPPPEKHLQRNSTVTRIELLVQFPLPPTSEIR